MDLLCTCYRKPEWDWNSTPQMLEQAERNIRVTGGAIGGDSGEYYPAAGVPAGALNPPLPADALFPQDWIDRAAAMPGDRGGHFKGNYGAPSQFALPPIPEFYTGTLPGFVFCAITPVIEEMLARRMLALPAQFKDVVIHPNVPLFIFDSMAQLLLGIFHADSPTTMNMERQAFVQWLGPGQNGGSPLPVQLRFRVAIEVPPTPVQDPEVLAALGGAAKTLGGVLPPAETRQLANLLAKRVQTAQMMNTMAARGMTGKPPASSGSASGSGLFYQPPFKFVDTVTVDIRGNLFDIKRRLLGTNASAIMRIVDELGSKHNIRVRIRGQGSGFLEGPQNQELAQPLHFNISADSEQLLQAVVARVRQHVDQVRAEVSQPPTMHMPMPPMM
jgi:hypothetical protein